MSPVGCWRPPAGICTKVLGLIAWARETDGWVAVASPYRLPVATWVTGRRTWDALTVRVVEAEAAEAGWGARPATSAPVRTTAQAARGRGRVRTAGDMWGLRSRPAP